MTRVSTLQGFKEGFGVGDGRETGAAFADECPGGGVRGRGDLGEGPGQGFGERGSDKTVGSDAHDGFVDGEAGFSCGLQARGFGACADDNDLDGIEQEALEGEAVASGVEAEVLDHAGEGGERVFGDLAIAGASAERLKAQEGGGSGRVAGGGGRVLEGLAAGTENGQRRFSFRRGG